MTTSTAVCGLVNMKNKESNVKPGLISVKTSVISWKKKKQIRCISTSTTEMEGGKMVKGGLVYRQCFQIRSSEIGFDSRLSITSLMSYFQDTAVNHARVTGIVGDGQNLGRTKQMYGKDLIWVTPSFQLLVHHYPSWLDVIEMETWMYPSGQNGLGHDWIIRDTINGDTIAQATSVYVLMNKETRKLSKFIKEVRQEFAAHMMDCKPILNHIHTPKFTLLDLHTADFSCTGLKAAWNDIDANQHVNSTKYINWILESVPRSLMEHHQLFIVNLKYRRECNINSELNSLSRILTEPYVKNQNEKMVLEHVLCLDNGLEVLRGHTVWTPRRANYFKM